MAAPNYNVLAVALDEYVLAVEAPLGSEASAAVVARLHEMFPARAIRYVVPTHHHDDHAGGIRAFVAAGATLVTTSGNVDFFRRMAGARRTIEPDVLARNPAPIVIEVIEGRRRVFRDARHMVEIHDVGPNPHAEEHTSSPTCRRRNSYSRAIWSASPTAGRSSRPAPRGCSSPSASSG